MEKIQLKRSFGEFRLDKSQSDSKKRAITMEELPTKINEIDDKNESVDKLLIDNNKIIHKDDNLLSMNNNLLSTNDDVNDINELENKLLSIISNENIFNLIQNNDNINLLRKINFNLSKLNNSVIKRLVELKKKKESEINDRINMLKNDLMKLNSNNFISYQSYIFTPNLFLTLSSNSLPNSLEDNNIIILPKKK